MKDTPLSVKIVDGDLVIRIGVDTLAFCFDRHEENNQWDEGKEDFIQKLKIIDPDGFAKDVLIEMGREEENGSTPLTDFLDAMSQAAVEQGSIYVEECGMPSVTE